MIDYERIGKRIYEQRKMLRKISQEKMAEDLGMYQADISNLEKAKSGSGIQDLSKLDMIAEYFNMPLESLLFGQRPEDSMVKYYGSAMKIHQCEGKYAMKAEHLPALSRLTGQSPEEINCSAFECGPYTIYGLISLQFKEDVDIDKADPEDLPDHIAKLHLFAFCHSDIVASLTMYCLQVGNMLCRPQFESARDIIPQEIMDPYFCLAVLNPYAPFLSGSEDAVDRFMETQEKLSSFAEMPVLLIDSLYVREDCRRYGMFRMLLDVLNYAFGEEKLVWLNLEPAADELHSELGASPRFTTAVAGQMNLNAAVAERLGFCIDPVFVERRVEVIGSNGETNVVLMPVRKYAYIIPEALKEVVKGNGLQPDSEMSQGLNHLEDDTADDFFSGELDGKKVAVIECHNVSADTVYVFGVSENRSCWFGVSKNNPLKEGLGIKFEEKYPSKDEARDSVYGDYIGLISDYFEYAEGHN